jgi:hypothetical protein
VKEKSPGEPPGAAIVKIENIPAGAADGLDKIEIALVPGKSMEHDGGWMMG